MYIARRCATAMIVLMAGLTLASCTASGDSAEGRGQEWDPSSWEPTVTISRVVYTDEERDEFRLRWLASLARSREIADPPSVPLERWTTVGQDNSETLARCYTEAGFPAVGDPSGGVHFNPGVPDSQEDALNLAMYTCMSQFFLDPVYLTEWTDDQAGLLWDYWDQYEIPCLEAHGLSGLRAGQPSRATFIAEFPSAWWGPVNAFEGQELDAQFELQRECPPYPPPEVFYGS